MASHVNPTNPLVSGGFFVDRHSDNTLHALVREELPGATPYYRSYSCSLDEPEELAKFFDDLTHELRIWYQLACSALEDITAYQPSVWS